MDQFERIKVLGRGSCGVAMLVRERGSGRRGHLRVIKEIDLIRMPAAAQSEAQAEAGVLRSLSHINIIAHYATFIESSKLHIVMEFADGGDLACEVRQRRNEAGCFNQDEALSMFMQCCLALQHVHLRHVLHRDLKCQNIFLTKAKVVKLGDFGIAKVLENTAGKAMTMIGTPSYLPPEVVDNKPYGFKADIWSLGVVLYELLVLEPPFQGNCLAALVLKIVTTEPKPVPSHHYSEEVRGMVTSCLQKNPDKRPSTDELLDLPTLRHGIGLLPSAVIEHIRSGGTVAEAPMPVENLDLTRLPTGRMPLQTASPALELASAQSPAIQRVRRRSNPRPVAKVQQLLGVVGEDACSHEPPLQLRAPVSDDHRRTPSESRNSTRAPTPEGIALWQMGGGGGANFSGGDAVDAFLLNRHASGVPKHKAADAMSPRDGFSNAANAQRPPPRNARPRDASPLKDVAEFFPIHEVPRPMRARGEAELQGRMWSPECHVGRAVSSTATPRRERIPSRREAKMALDLKRGLDGDSPLVGLAVGLPPGHFHLRKSPRSQDDFPSLSEIILPATPSLGADSSPLGLLGTPTPGPVRPRESPRTPLGPAENRRDGSRKPRSTIGLVGAGMIAGGKGLQAHADDMSSQAVSNYVEDDKSTARPSRSPPPVQTPGISRNGLADISNLFGDTFARELMVEPPAPQRLDFYANSIPQWSQAERDDDIVNLFGETFAQDELVFSARERPDGQPSQAPRAGNGDSLVLELAKLCAAPAKTGLTGAEAMPVDSRANSHMDSVEDDNDDALSDSWAAAKSCREELELTLTTPYSVRPSAEAAL